MQRSIAWLKAQGYDPVRKVEYWNSYARIRQDLWGFDIAAVHPFTGFTLVQVTDGAHLAAHRDKLAALPSTEKLRGKVQMCFHSWSKLGARGKRKTWQMKEEAI